MVLVQGLGLWVGVGVRAGLRPLGLVLHQVMQRDVLELGRTCSGLGLGLGLVSVGVG